MYAKKVSVKNYTNQNNNEKPMQLVQDKISLDELKKMSENMFDSLVKAVVDINQHIMVVDAPMHADEEAYLLENGSEQEHLWGINIYPHKWGTAEGIVFDSMINIRPKQGNRTRGVENSQIREQIIQIVTKLIKS